MTVSVVWADDLTGAAEAADTWQAATPHREVRIVLGTPENTVPAAAQVWDLDLRHTNGARAQSLLTTALGRLDRDGGLYFKLDSQLRGPVRAYVHALLRSGRSLVLSAANPALGRITTDGVHQIPRPEGPPALISLRSVFAGLAHRHLTAAEHDQLPTLVSTSAPVLVTADVTNDVELHRLARYVRRSPRTHLAGSAPFLGAVASSDDRDGEGARRRPAATPVPQLFAVLGTTEPAAHAQVQALRDRDPSTTLVTAPPTDAPDAVAAAAGLVRAGLVRGAHVVLSAAPPAIPAGHHPPEAMAALASTCAIALAGVGPDVALYLSGGHTARTVLERLDLTTLRTVPGTGGAVAHLLAADGRTILTKPGSYGRPTVLLDLAARTSHPPTPEKDSLP